MLYVCLPYSMYVYIHILINHIYIPICNTYSATTVIWEIFVCIYFNFSLKIFLCSEPTALLDLHEQVNERKFHTIQ